MVHIEKISLRGFKSFGNQRVGIPISKGFTAIVGPNGAGKSNVVDGLCFVLGRMSTKSMRAERFSDLIWVGNENFPPGSYAEVSLHLNNSDRKLPLDESKVVISRRVDRSGRSVYRTNKKRMARNEIVDLLAMAGIFPEGYNIVLQGDITKFTKMTPLERRLLIDELSGIAEYDLKKEKSLRELSKAEENIRATNLVIDEVLSQLRRLERERDEAVRYQDLITQVKEMRWQFQNNQLRKYRERYEAILERTGKGSERIEEIEDEIGKINSEIERKRERQEELERTIEKRQEIDQERVGKQTEEVRAQIVRAQENFKNTEENLERQRQNYRRLEEDMESIAEKVKEKKNKVRVLESQRGNITSSLEGLRSEQASLQKKISGLEEDNSKLREELASVEAGLSEARATDLIARQNNSRASMDLNRAREELTYLQRSVKDESGRMEGLKKKRINVENDISNLESELSSLTEEIGELGGDLEGYSRSLSGVEKDLEGKSSEETRMEAFLKASKDSKNSVRKAISYLLEKREEGGIDGVVGTISELAKVPERFSVPISAATGHLSDYLVVESRDVAARCIKLLKDNRIGWANFIPIKELERLNSKPDAASLKERGVVGLALNLVEFNEELKSLYDFVLGRTVVTESLDFSNSLPRKFRTVTMDGEVLDPSGIISGGYYDASDPGLGPMLSFNEKDLSTIRQEVESLKVERKEISRTVNELRSSLLTKEKKRAEVEASITGKRSDRDVLDREIAELESKMGDMKRSVEEAGKKLKELEAQTENSELTAKNAGRALAEAEKKRDELLHEIESPELKRLDMDVREVSAKTSQKVESDSKLRADMVALKREIEYLEESRKRMKEDLKNIKQAMSGLKVVLDKIGKDIPVLDKELSHLIASEGDIREEIKQLRSIIFAEKHDLSELVQKRDSLVEDKNRLSVDINSSVYERSQLDLQIHSLEHELSLVDYEYEPVELDDLETISKRVTVLEAEKSKLEPVNMRAIEAYEETEEKFNEYKERRDKVLEEREAILQFMSEIETKKKQVFMEAFENIAVNFESIFEKLSPGGAGKLLLENYEDPFEGGLEIEAKPAGKELSVIDSMSGGEKALTALAFIFAVQGYKPSPFYILDEIDAHLDDDNVKRVAELVAETSKGSQFIVVTLRDSMMAQADELIGVGMEDNGVTKVVGVRMEAGHLVEGAGGVEAEAGGAQA